MKNEEAFPSSEAASARRQVTTELSDSRPAVVTPVTSTTRARRRSPRRSNGEAGRLFAPVILLAPPFTSFLSEQYHQDSSPDQQRPR